MKLEMHGGPRNSHAEDDREESLAIDDDEKEKASEGKNKATEDDDKKDKANKGTKKALEDGVDWFVIDE